MISRAALLVELAAASIGVDNAADIPSAFSEAYDQLMERTFIEPTTKDDASKSSEWDKDHMKAKDIIDDRRLTFMVPVKLDDADNSEEGMSQLKDAAWETLDDEEKEAEEKKATEARNLKVGQASDLMTYKAENEDLQVIHVVPPQDGEAAWGEHQLIGKEGQQATLLAYYNGMKKYLTAPGKKETMVVPLLGALSWNAPEKQKSENNYRKDIAGSGRLHHKELGTMLVAYMCLDKDIKTKLHDNEDKKQFAIWSGLANDQFGEMISPKPKGLGLSSKFVESLRPSISGPRAGHDAACTALFNDPGFPHRDRAALQGAVAGRVDEPKVCVWADDGTGANTNNHPDNIAATMAAIGLVLDANPPEAFPLRKFNAAGKAKPIRSPITEFTQFGKDTVQRAAMRLVYDLNILPPHKIVDQGHGDGFDAAEMEGEGGFEEACAAFMKTHNGEAPADTTETTTEPAATSATPASSATPTAPTATTTTAPAGCCTYKMMIVSVVIVLAIGAGVVAALVMCTGEDAE